MASGSANDPEMARVAHITLEVCVEDIGGLHAAVTGGAGRIELCSALPLGGLTPSTALMNEAARASIPVYALIRPRAGDFIYDAAEESLIAADIRAAAAAGLAGVVIGANVPGGALDVALLRRLVACARDAGSRRGSPLALTLHRAFDLCPDLAAALEEAIDLGFDRVLTSGGAVNALTGREVLADLVRQGRGRIQILAGSGVNPTNVGAILASGVEEVHASCQVPLQETDPKLIELGFIQPHAKRTAPARVAALMEAIESWRRTV